MTAKPIWEPHEEPTDEEQANADAWRELIDLDGPTHMEALQYMRIADELGFGDAPDLIDRAIKAAKATVQRQTDAVQRRLQALAERDDEGHHLPIVYYMRSGKLVKIGTTGSLNQRFTSIAAQGVMAVEYGSYDLERERHQQFAHIRSYGEWFELTPELGEHIVKTRETFAQEAGMSTDEWLAPRLPKRRYFGPARPGA